MREYRTPGTVRGRSGNWPSYLDFLCSECGHVIVDDQGNPIREHENLVRWIRGEDLEASAVETAEGEHTESALQPEEVGPDSGYRQFTCPECGGHLLDEVTVTVRLLDFDETGAVQFGKCCYDDDEEHFKCSGCGWIVQDEENNRLDSYEALLDWMETNQE